MAEQSKEQAQAAVNILFNAASQARLTAAEHDQVKQAVQIVAAGLGLTEGQDNTELVMPDESEG